MNDDSSGKSSRRQWIWLGGIVVFVLGVGVLLLILFAVWRSRVHQRVTNRVAAIRSAGLPTNWEELSEWVPAVPDAENAAFVYTNAFAHIQSGDWTVSKLGVPRRGEALVEDRRVIIAAAVRTNQMALELAHSASNLFRARYPVVYTDGPLTGLPHLKGLSSIAVLLACEALLRVEAGDAEGAGASIQTSFDVTRSVESEPILISQLTRRRMLAVSCDSLERTLCRASVSEKSLTGFQKSLVSAEATNGFHIALIGERAMGMEFIRLAHEDVRRMTEVSNKGMNEEDKTEVPPVNPGSGWRFLGIFERDRDFFLRAMETNINSFSVSPPASFAFSNDLEKVVQDSATGHYLISSMLLPALSVTALEADAAQRATLRAALVAVGIERWRLAHGGSIPDSLEVLVPSVLPAVPQDPFDGRPLRFKKLSKGYVVYSIGQDFQDDGGKPRPPLSSGRRSSTNRFDITFSVER